MSAAGSRPSDRPRPVEDPQRCAPLANRRGDQREATAPPAPRWLLVEEPGPWGRNALVGSRLDERVSRAVLDRARAAGLRPTAIRRPGRDPMRGPRRWAVVDARPGRESTTWGFFDDDRELLDIPVEDDPSRGGTAEDIWLVCTHARHDTCCAVRGRPAASALAAVRPEQTWECSHVGGCRFAANVVVLPYALYYADVGPADVGALVATHEAGRVDPVRLRGRASFTAPVQAAQQHARRALAEDRIHALAPTGVSRTEDGGWRVDLDLDGRALQVLLAEGVSEPARLTCAAVHRESVRTFTLRGLAYDAR